MRRTFGQALYEEMKVNDKIFIVTGDLGYILFDNHRKDFPDRFINVQAAEQVMIGVAVGLALEGKVPIVYSITPFLLCRPYETIRNYINFEKIPVILCGSGRDKDYRHDGFSHFATDDIQILSNFDNIHCFWPETKEEIPYLLKRAIQSKEPYYINLKR